MVVSKRLTSMGVCYSVRSRADDEHVASSKPVCAVMPGQDLATVEHFSYLAVSWGCCATAFQDYSVGHSRPAELHWDVAEARLESSNNDVAVRVESRSSSGSNCEAVAQILPPLPGHALERLDQREQPELCVLCLTELAGEHLGVCVRADGRRACPHYFHISCLRRVEGCYCPQCRTRFMRRQALPSIAEKPAAWGRLVALSGTEFLDVKDISTALKAMLPLSPDTVDTLVSTWWPHWSRRRLLRTRELTRVFATIQHLLPNLPSEASSLEARVCAMPNRHIKVPGTLCGCGKVHVLRGDRVQRGPAWSGRNDDGGEGQLGTAVRVDESIGIVLVRWDRAPEEDFVHRYAWPSDPSLHEVSHAAFEDCPRDVRALQAATALSSAAAECVLLKSNYNLDAALAFCSDPSKSTSENTLRAPVALFQRVRVLPDVIHLQNWFDLTPCCRCVGRPVQVQWTAHAERHVGREGYLVGTHSCNDTVQLEFTGRCHCQIWLPRLAVTPVYDPDTATQPRFSRNTRVLCKIGNGWWPGVVSSVWWRELGWRERPTAPYSVRLDDGRNVYAPRDSDAVVRASPERGT